MAKPKNQPVDQTVIETPVEVVVTDKPVSTAKRVEELENGAIVETF